MLRSLVERYSLSGAAFQMPDTPAPPPSDPPAPPPAPDAPPAAVAGDPPAPVEPPVPVPSSAAPPWALERISEATAARRTAEQEATHWRELAERLQAAPPSDAPPALAPPASRTAAPAPSYEADVARGVAAQKLVDDSIEVLNAGTNEFKDTFANTRSVLMAVGFLENDVVGDLVAADKAGAHKIMTELAKDPERAAQIARMDSRRRTAEFTRISMTIAAPKPVVAPAPSSAAPPPRPALAPVAAPPENDGLSDDVSDDEFSRNWDAQNLKRTG